MRWSTLCAPAVMLCAAGCSKTHAGTSADEGTRVAARGEQGHELGQLMVQIARRFEVAGKAAVARRFELAGFEIGELEEMFEDDIPVAKLPKDGPSGHIPAMAQAFLKANIPDLKRGAASRDTQVFAVAFQHAAATCNGCHRASAKSFIVVPSVPGMAVPDVGPVPPFGERTAADGGVAPVMTVKAVPLPGATGPASIDYIAYEPPTHGGARVWVPVGLTGSVDVFDIATGSMRRVDGFKTGEREWQGEKHTVGPSSVTLAGGFAYVGDRASNEVCAVDRKTLTLGPCIVVPGAIDAVAAVTSRREIWVTTPSDRSIAILDASGPGGRLKLAGSVPLEGSPKGYAVDEAHGIFYTNIEDKSSTVAVDVNERALRSTWSNGCGEDGPRGVAVDGASGFVMVACTDHVEVLDGAHDGALRGKFDTGLGVDNIDYVPGTQKLFVAAGKAGLLTVLGVGAKGKLTVSAWAETREGARNAVADDAGNAYIADSRGASLLVASLPAK